MKLQNLVTVSSAFQRSTRLEKDMAPEAHSDLLTRYVPMGTCLGILEQMGDAVLHSQQRAFTWTGPYGSGKSSLALMLCSLLQGGETRESAAQRLGLFGGAAPSANAAFTTGAAWEILAITGHQGRLADDIAKALNLSATQKTLSNATITSELERRAKSAATTEGGLLLIIDELGKYLEADAASENAYLLQELAETFNRLEGKNLFVGILHQAFDAYASRLPREVRAEWEKVKGRFVDMPLLGNAEELLTLLSKAIVKSPDLPEATSEFTQSVNRAAHELASRRSFDEAHLKATLLACRPLNPVTALLLSAVSRRSFAQNERSIFSFLSSREPHGFPEFLDRAAVDALYTPADFWDYLKANFEGAILSTPEAHRWMTAVEAVERAELKGSAEHTALARTLALVHLFKSGTGLEATLPLLAAGTGANEVQTKQRLDDLVQWKVAIERRYAGSWSLFAGSDFNLEGRLAEALAREGALDATRIAKLLSLQPVVARSYYMEMGTLSWFDRVILPVEEVAHWLDTKREDTGRAGFFLFVIPSAEDKRTPKELCAELAAQYGAMTSTGEALLFGAIPKMDYRGGGNKRFIT